MRTVLLATSVTLGLWALGADASAREAVVLVRPQSDPLLQDAFHRLGAELELHDFDVQRVETDLGVEPSTVLQDLGKSHGALATIGFVQRQGNPAIELWLVDRVSGKVTMRVIELPQGEDASSVIAIRAVDLLKASLLELQTTPTPPPGILGVERRPIPTEVRRFVEPAPPGLWMTFAVASLWEPQSFGGSFGPSFGLQSQRGAPWRWGVTVQGPLLGGALQAESLRVRATQGLALAEAQWVFWRGARLEAGVGLGLGAYALLASGEATAPYRGVTDHLWSGAGSAGFGASYGLGRHVALDAGLRAVALYPRVGVELEPGRRLIRQPALDATLGLEVGL